MKLKTIFHRAAAGALCLLLCVSSLAQTALAANAAIDPGRKGTLTIRYDPDYTGVTFWVYRVAGVDADGRFTMDANSGYQNYLSQINSKSTSWWSLAKELRNTASRLPAGQKGLVKTLSGSAGVLASDEAGKVCRELKLTDLLPGLYLVVCSDYTQTQTVNGSETRVLTVTTAPALVSIPNVGQDKNGNPVWEYDLISDMRAKSQSVTESSRVKNIQVTKSWTSYGYDRPASVTIDLYRRNRVTNVSELYQSFTMSDQTGWNKIWTNLDALNYDYFVVERNVPDGYTSHVTWVDDYNVAIANVHTPPPSSVGSDPVTTVRVSSPVTGTPRPSSVPDVPIDDPDVPLGNRTPPPADTPSDEEIELDDPDVPLGDLPQTGQLWWPVPLLAVSGMFLVLVGLVVRRRGEYDEE